MTALALPASSLRVEPFPTRTRTRAALALALALVVAAAAHVLAALDHVESAAAASFFVAVAAGQAGLAFACLRHPSRPVRLGVAASTALLLGVWAASRIVGIAIGHAHGPEGVGLLDAIAVAAEAVVLILVTAVAPRAPWRRVAGIACLLLALAGTVVTAAARPATGQHGTPEPVAATAPPGPFGPARPVAQAPCSGHACQPHAHP